MTYAGKAPDLWSETALLTLEDESGNKMHYKTITDTIDFDFGEKNFETIITIGGTRLTRFTPETDSSVTLELYPVAAGSDWSSSAGEEGVGFFDLLHSVDADYGPSQTAAAVLSSISNDTNHSRYRMTIMWTNNSTLTDATAEVPAATADKAALRISVCGYFTTMKPSFTDDVLKVTATFKIPAFTRSGVGNILVESTDESDLAALTALSAFSSSTNFR